MIGTSKVSLSDDDAKKVAVEVAAILAPKPVAKPVTEPAVEVVEVQKVDGDPSATVYHETEAKLIAQLANPKMIQVITKKGARLHNLTENALNALHDLGKERKIFKQYM